MKNACPKCNHLQEEDVEHVCPSPQYLALHRQMIREAIKAEEMFGIDELERFSCTLPTFKAMVEELKAPTHTSS